MTSGSAPAREATPDLSSAAPAAAAALAGPNGGDVSAAESEPAAPFRVVRGTPAATSGPSVADIVGVRRAGGRVPGRRARRQRDVLAEHPTDSGRGDGRG